MRGQGQGLWWKEIKNLMCWKHLQNEFGKKKKNEFGIFLMSGDHFQEDHVGSKKSSYKLWGYIR